MRIAKKLIKYDILVNFYERNVINIENTILCKFLVIILCNFSILHNLNIFDVKLS